MHWNVYFIILMVITTAMAGPTRKPPRTPSSTSPPTSPPRPESCPTALKRAGISPMFASMVTHSIHSLTLEDIRYYFNNSATEENGVPTVNMDLKSEQRVLPNAPLAGYDMDFSTSGMRAFDLVLRNMDRSWWGVSGYNTLEKIGHALHMSEAWTNAAQQYKSISKTVDPDSEVCACLNDVESNGIMDHLNLIAFKIRYPGITSGNKNITTHFLDLHPNNNTTHRQKRAGPGSEIDYSAKKGPFKYDAAYHANREEGILYAACDCYDPHEGIAKAWKRSGKANRFQDIDFDQSDVKLLAEVAEKLVDGDVAEIPHLDSAEHWTYWRDMFKMGKHDKAHFDLAMFLFCKLNEDNK